MAEMREFPSNSMTPKLGRQASQPKPEVHKVVSGKARKKSAGRRFASSFIAEDAHSVGEYIVMDVLLPATKNVISDMISEGVQRMLFGDSGPRRNKNVRDNRTIVSYNKYYNDRPSRPAYSRRARATHDFDELVYASRDEADLVIDKLADLIDQYGAASVRDLYDLSGVTAEYTDENWGWYSVGGASARRIRDGYILDLPKPVVLEKD